MLSTLNGYTPEHVQFVLPKAAQEKFPLVLFEGATDPENTINLVREKFVAIFPDNESAPRKYDEFEIAQIREEYCVKQENDIPVRMDELAEAIETAKRMKKDAEDRLAATQQEIRDLAAKVKEGTTEFFLSSKYTARIALGGYYLYYSWVDGKFQLVKADKIPEWDKRTLWAQEDQNRIALKEMFGYEVPETEKPSSNDADMPFEG